MYTMKNCWPRWSLAGDHRESLRSVIALREGHDHQGQRVFGRGVWPRVDNSDQGQRVYEGSALAVLYTKPKKSCIYRQHRHWVSTSHLWRRSRSWLPRHHRLFAGETGSKHLPLVRLRVRCRKRWSSHCSSRTRRQKLFLGPMLRLQLNCILSENIITNNNYTIIWSKRRSVLSRNRIEQNTRKKTYIVLLEVTHTENRQRDFFKTVV